MRKCNIYYEKSHLYNKVYRLSLTIKKAQLVSVEPKKIIEKILLLFLTR